jgi:hypothetical protein
MQLDLFTVTADRLENRVGYTQKKRHKVLTATVACWILQQSNYQIDLPEEESRRLGCGNIWEYLGWKFPTRGEDFIPIDCPTEFQRFQAAQMNGPHIRGGFGQLRKALLNDHRRALFMVPRHEDGKRTQIITLNPDYVVNDKGTTAAQMAEKRQTMRVKWSVRSGAEKIAAMHSTIDCLAQLASSIQGVFQEIKDQGLPTPRLSSQEALERLSEQRQQVGQ